MHKDAIDSPFRLRNSTRQELLLESIARDESRLKSMKSRVDSARNGAKKGNLSTPAKGTWEASLADFRGPVSSGLSLGSGEYFIRMGVGTPAKNMYLVVDTGSDLAWLQCSPCTSCYKQADPVYFPRASSSYKQFSCGSSMCEQLDIHGCQSNGCLYQVSYGDGSFTIGEFASEAFSAGLSVVSNVAFGCGHDNEGLFVGAAGLLGLGSGDLSFASQIGSKLGKTFSYCLVGRSKRIQSSSSLVFGNSAIPGGAKFTPLVFNPTMETFYYVPLTGISIGGLLLPIPVSTFKINSGGSGGVIIDTGTSVTRLTNSAYLVMRNAFRAATRSLPSASPFSIFDTCYDLSRWGSVEVPTVTLHFDSGVDLSLPATNYMVQVNDAGTYCFAFAGNSKGLSIIGNIQQQGIRVAIDGQNNRIAFAERQC
ncbi:hypothetical protein O6H91_07G046100 [Diphasiastrum complanatum]|nr:hypothetical protein O6H91_07G046100 [Diphasiastrum complanatum]